MNSVRWIIWEDYDHFPEFDRPHYRPEIIRVMPSAPLKIDTKALTSSIAFYESIVSSLPKLTDGETIKLFKEYNWYKHQWNLAKRKEEKQKLEEMIREPQNELILSNLRYSSQIGAIYARKFKIDKNDVVQEINLTIGKSIDRYRATKYPEVPFSAYLIDAINKEIIRWVNSQKFIKIPPRKKALLNLLNEECYNFLDLYERKPTLEELAQIVNLPENEIDMLLGINQEKISLDYLIDDNRDIF